MTSQALPPGDADPSPTWRAFLGAFSKIGVLSFGGPAAQIAVMHRTLIDERRWLREDDFLHALNFCMLLPGPEAQQLATYAGWRLKGVWGGVAAGLLFIAPGAAAMFAIAFAYGAYAERSIVESAFGGVRAAVVAIVFAALARLAGKSLRSDSARIAALGAFLALFFFGAPFPIVIGAAALFGFLTSGESRDVAPPPPPLSAGRSRGAFQAALVCAFLWLAPLALIVVMFGRDHAFAELALFFSKLAVVTFGGAYAALSYVAQIAADNAWVAPQTVMDGLALAETTPGPLVLVLQFIAVQTGITAQTGLPPHLAGATGGMIALWMTFAPCFLWIFLGAPFMERLRGMPALSSALAVVSGAVVGVILNLSLWFAAHALFARVGAWRAGPVETIAPDFQSIDMIAVAIAAASFAALSRWKGALIPVLAASAIAGAALMG